jgi:Zn-dependent protease
MQKILISIISFLAFIAGLYFLTDIGLFMSIGFVFVLLVHELGHVFALIKLDGSIKRIYFFPFLGAIVTSDKKLKTENEYAYFKYLGPLTGTLGTLITLVLFFLFKDPRFLNLVFVGAIVNIINLIPITLLDGYGMLRGSIKYVKWFGFSILVILGLFVFHEYIITLFILIIFVLFSESSDKKYMGYRLHEIILASIFLLAIIVLTILDTNKLVWNIPVILLSIYFIFIYIKTTCLDVKKEQDVTQNEVLLPLNNREKILWIARWVSLTLILFAVAYYVYPLL